MSNITDAARWLHEVPERRSGVRNTNVVVNEDGTISYTKPNGEKAIFSKSDISNGYARMIKGTDRDFDRTEEADRSYEPGATGQPLLEETTITPDEATTTPVPVESVQPVPLVEDTGKKSVWRDDKPLDDAIRRLEEIHGSTITKTPEGYSVEDKNNNVEIVTANDLLKREAESTAKLDAAIKHVEETQGVTAYKQGGVYVFHDEEGRTVAHEPAVIIETYEKDMATATGDKDSTDDALTPDEEKASLIGWDFEGWGKGGVPTYDARSPEDIENQLPPKIQVDWTLVGAIVRHQQSLAKTDEYGGEPTEEEALRKARELGPNFTAEYNPQTATWYPVEKEEEKEKPILTLDQQIAKLVGEGRIEEAMRLDQVRDQLNEERLTPERAAEMLVDIAYNPADFKQMMDAMLGRDSGLDATTVDIAQLQAQATRMLKGTEAEGLPELPQGFRDLASGAKTGQDLTRARYQAPEIEGDISAGDPVVPSPVYARPRAVDRDLMAETVPFPSRGLMPAGRMTATDEEEFAPGISFEQRVRRSNLDQRPSLLDYEDIEMGDYGSVTPTEDTDPFNTVALIKKHRNPNDPANWLSGFELRKMMSEKGLLDSGQKGVDREFTPYETTAAAVVRGKDVAELGYDAFQRAQEAQELRDLYSGANYPGSLNIPYTSTRERLRELGKYLGKDAAAFERNQRRQQERRQQIFEARRPAGATRRYM